LFIIFVFLNRKGESNIIPYPINNSSPLTISSEIEQNFITKPLYLLDFFVSIIMPNISPLDLGLNSSSFDNIILNYKGEDYDLVYINNFLSSYLDKRTKKQSSSLNFFYDNNTFVAQNLLTISLGQDVVLGLNALNKRGEVIIHKPIITIDITTIFPLNSYTPQTYTINNVWINGQLQYVNFSYLTPLINYEFSDIIDNNVLGQRLKIILQKGQPYIEQISNISTLFSPIGLVNFLTLLAQTLNNIPSLKFISSYIYLVISSIEKEESMFYNFSPLYLQPLTSSYKGYTYPVAGPAILTYNVTPYPYSTSNINLVNSLYKRVDKVICSPFSIIYSDKETNKNIKDLIDNCT
jgi:hypothetical protein